MSTCVFFCGGYKATQTDMNVWAGSARAQRSDVEFNAFAWPRGADPDATSAVATATRNGQLESAVKAIAASSADSIFIVGHSSGCAIANAVDRKLEDHARIVLVALDGFGPDRNQLARATTQVWAAACDGATSRNHAR